MKVITGGIKPALIGTEPTAIVLDYSLFGQEAAESNVPLAIWA